MKYLKSNRSLQQQGCQYCRYFKLLNYCRFEKEKIYSLVKTRLARCSFQDCSCILSTSTKVSHLKSKIICYPCSVGVALICLSSISFSLLVVSTGWAPPKIEALAATSFCRWASATASPLRFANWSFGLSRGAKWKKFR